MPKEYIQEAMGHSVMSGTIIDRYIRSYPIDQQMQFNSKLPKVGRPGRYNGGTSRTYPRSDKGFDSVGEEYLIVYALRSQCSVKKS